MPGTQPASSRPSFSSLSEQPSKTLNGFVRRSTKLWLPLSPFPFHSDEKQETPENIIVSPRTINFLSRESPQSEPSSSESDSSLPERIEINDHINKSIFEDWEDPFIPRSTVFLENDGTQTLLITPQSAFFYPPPSPRPFGYEPFSKGFFEQDLSQMVFSNLHLDDDDDFGPVLLTPKCIEHVSEMAQQQQQSTQKQHKGILFIDTNTDNKRYQPFSYSEWSASIFCSPKQQHLGHGDETASWAPKGLIAYGPDVPLDLDFECIYSAGDVSPGERWDEKLWSPISLRKGLRTAPCA